MYRASKKWWGPITGFKQVYHIQMRKAHFDSNQNRASILAKDISAVTRSRKSSSSGKTPLQKMRHGNCDYSSTVSIALALRTRMILMGEEMLGSNPNPFIYVISPRGLVKVIVS